MSTALAHVLPARRALVSVIIPVHNSLATLGRALASVQAQTTDAILEIIVVDDGSEEDVRGFLRQHFPGTKYLRRERGGPSVARNTGVAEASGELIAFLDADDEWYPGKLATQLAALEQRPEVGLMLSRYRRVYQSGRRTGSGHFPALLEVEPLDWFCTRRRRHLGRPMCPSGWLIKRELYLELGGQNPLWVAMADWHLVMQALVAGHSVLLSGKPLFDYHITPGGVSSHNRQHDLQWLGEEMIRYLGDLQEAADTDAGTFDPALCRRLILDERVFRAHLLLRHGYLQGAHELLEPVLDRTVPVGQRLAQWPTMMVIKLLRRLLGPRSHTLQNSTLKLANWWYQIVP